MKEAQKEKRKKSRIRRTQFKESSNIPSLSPPDQGISFSFIGSVRILGKGGVARPHVAGEASLSLSSVAVEEAGSDASSSLVRSDR